MEMSCGLLAVFVAVLTVAAWRDGRRVKEIVPLVFRTIGGMPLFLAFALASAGARGWSAAALYLLALLSLLFISAYHFVNIVMMYISPRDEPSDV